MADTKYISYIEDDNNQYKFQLDHPQQVTMQDGNTLLSDIIDGKKDTSVQLGHHNFLNGHNIAVCGYNNETAYSNTFLFGRELEAAAENQTILGQYNVPEKDIVFAIGNGSEGNRNNILKLTKDSLFIHGKEMFKYEQGIVKEESVHIEPIKITETQIQNFIFDSILTDYTLYIRGSFEYTTREDFPKFFMSFSFENFKVFNTLPQCFVGLKNNNQPSLQGKPKPCSFVFDIFTEENTSLCYGYLSVNESIDTTSASAIPRIVEFSWQVPILTR